MKSTPISEPKRTLPPPIVWTIAGTDPGGGAGIQADLKTFAGLGVYGCSVITAVVAQNTQGVRYVRTLDAEIVREQIQTLAEDLPPVAIKIGMLGTAEIVSAVAEAVRNLNVPVICDPVLRSSSGSLLLPDEAIDVFTSELAPLCTLCTPNWPETEHLCSCKISGTEDVEAAACIWHQTISASVLIKGGHASGDWLCDYWSTTQDLANGRLQRQMIGMWIKSRRIKTRHTHGTGCTMSSAIAAALARGLNMHDALLAARAYVNQGLRTPPGVGTGNGPLGHGDWPLLKKYYPVYQIHMKAFPQGARHSQENFCT